LYYFSSRVLERFVIWDARGEERAARGEAAREKAKRDKIN